MRYILLILYSTIFCLCEWNPALAEEISLMKAASITATALATNDSITLEKYLLTYEEASDLSDKIKQQSKADYIKERDESISNLWRDVRKENIVVDHFEIRDVFVKKMGFVTPRKYAVVAFVNPVFLHKGREIRSPFLSMMFLQIGNQWKYLHKA